MKDVIDGRSILCCIVMTVQCVVAVAQQHIDTTGCWLRPSNPLHVCEMGVVSVDGETQLIRLTWHPSTDTGIAGYYICTGAPCVDYDTVWGAKDTTYLCMDHDPREQHIYRLLAFDSCLNGSPLSPPCGNLTLSYTLVPCTHRLTLEWNAYQNMEGGLRRYELHFADGVVVPIASQHNHFDTLVPRDVDSVSVRVVAVGGSFEAWSNQLKCNLTISDTCPPPPLPPDTLVPEVRYLYFPNVFMPLQGTNNLFRPIYAEGAVKEYNIFIYNRMGLLVFSADDVDMAWDGTYRGQLLPQGAYVYYVRYRVGDAYHTMKGTITLLR